MRRLSALTMFATAAVALAGCSTTPVAEDHARLEVVTTTGILADLARNVAGDLADVRSLVPEGGDPHSYEPTLRNVRDIVYADLAFSNYLMLEEQNLIKTLDANVGEGVPNISIAEEAAKYGAEVIPLIEDMSLDTIWLGLRVRGSGAEYGATRSSEIELSATGVEGPGRLVNYLTGTFGDAEVYFDSGDGFDASDSYRNDTAQLPPDAHTHLSWVFTEPGVYTLDLSAAVRADADAEPIPVTTGTVTFAVGVSPHGIPGKEDAQVLDAGHSDITVDLDAKAIRLLLDHVDAEGQQRQDFYDADDVVIEVPNKALKPIPGDPRFRFLGEPGTEVYQLAQAVLGRHVHGDIDPHLWQNVRNVIAYVQVIRDELIKIDPAHADEYTTNAERYSHSLEDLDDMVRTTIDEIPEANRNLVTTHDAFQYLGRAYGVSITGFVTPNPAVETSIDDRKRLTQTIRNLRIPAVFLEPNLVSRASTLTEVAKEQGVEVCTIYGDAFDRTVNTYIDMMRANAESLRDCLGE